MKSIGIVGCGAIGKALIQTTENGQASQCASPASPAERKTRA